METPQKQQLLGRIWNSTRSVSFLNSFFSALVGLLNFMLVTRLLSKQEFGVWAFFISVYTLYDMVRSGLLNGATVKFVVPGITDEKLNQIENNVIQLGTFISILPLIATITYYVLGYNETHAQYELIAIGIVPLSLISFVSTSACWFLQAKQNFKRILKIRLSVQLTFFIALLIGFFIDMNLDGVFIGYVFAYAVAMFIALAGGAVQLKALFIRPTSQIKELIQFGGYSMGTLLGSNLLRNSDTYIIMAWLDATSVAMYNVPSRIMALLDIPLQAFAAADYPRMVALVEEKKFIDLQKLFNKGIGIAVLLIWPACAFVFVTAKWLVIIIAGSQYENTYLILRIFILYAALLPLDRYTGIALDALGKPEINLRKVIFMLATNVLLDIVVLSLGFGLESISAVSLATYAVGIGYGVWALRNQISLQFRTGISEALELILTQFKSKFQ